MLIIAHQLSAVRDADRVLVLDQGALVEEGSARELADCAGLLPNWRMLSTRVPTTALS